MIATQNHLHPTASMETVLRESIDQKQKKLSSTGKLRDNPCKLKNSMRKTRGLQMIIRRIPKRKDSL
jgi:hypothetical protein